MRYRRRSATNGRAFVSPIPWIDPLGLSQAPAGLPDEPGIYIITNKTLNKAYVGSAGYGDQGMHTRVSGSKHPAQDLRDHPDTVVQFKRVCLGTIDKDTPEGRSQANNVLRKYEKDEFDRTKKKGFEMLNDAPIQAASKVESTNALIDKHGTSKARNPSTAK